MGYDCNATLVSRLYRVERAYLKLVAHQYYSTRTPAMRPRSPYLMSAPIPVSLHLFSTHNPMRLTSLSASLTSLVLLAAPTATAPTVPTTVPKYFCFGNAIIAWRLIAYLGANYILHAAAVPAAADIGRYTERVTRRDAYRWRVWLGLISLFTPFFALARTIILIAEQLKCKGNDVLAALHHGALLVVVRDTDWEPSLAGEVVYAKLPDGFSEEKECVVRAKDALEADCRQCPPE